MTITIKRSEFEITYRERIPYKTEGRTEGRVYFLFFIL